MSSISSYHDHDYGPDNLICEFKSYRKNGVTIYVETPILYEDGTLFSPEKISSKEIPSCRFYSEETIYIEDLNVKINYMLDIPAKTIHQAFNVRGEILEKESRKRVTQYLEKIKQDQMKPKLLVPNSKFRLHPKNGNGK